jgi:hypothetical protein
MIGPAADPNLTVRAWRRLFERNEFLPTDHPTLTGNCDLARRLAVVFPATPLACRISVAAAIDPRFVGDSQRRGRDAPNEHDSEQRCHVRKSGIRCHFPSLHHRTPPRQRKTSSTLQYVALPRSRLSGLAVFGARLRYLARIGARPITPLRKGLACADSKKWLYIRACGRFLRALSHARCAEQI